MITYSRVAAKVWRLVHYFEPAIVRVLKHEDFEELDKEIFKWYDSVHEEVKIKSLDVLPIVGDPMYNIQRLKVWTRLRLNQVSQPTITSLHWPRRAFTSANSMSRLDSYLAIHACAPQRKQHPGQYAPRPDSRGRVARNDPVPSSAEQRDVRVPAHPDLLPHVPHVGHRRPLPRLHARAPPLQRQLPYRVLHGPRPHQGPLGQVVGVATPVAHGPLPQGLCATSRAAGRRHGGSVGGGSSSSDDGATPPQRRPQAPAAYRSRGHHAAGGRRRR